ncbi:arylamine N-acetyltransferase family protein [Mesobacillus zeae]|uniref:Arylamine N-acetyltransferase n=1 Tax=Mesobacillus zeae TaxID=1917180 RepID=A0A398BDP3_9BACI|nr:arylamine N-acetyltransferase [Mesobacillus zeae]RID87471.1 arylamine N-acetyltransferase [Mesobacillus zeae]
MPDIDLLFRQRIGFPEDEEITVDNLEVVLELTAKSIPFENICVINNNVMVMNETNLVDKILQHNEGGLCYELNAILYLFLRENGLNVQLVRGTVYNKENGSFSPTGKTHVATVLINGNERYLIDTGFGGNLPLVLVPFDGKVVRSWNGEFRVRKEDSEHGDYFLELKLKHKDDEWRKGYAFDSRQQMVNWDDLNVVQQIIVEHPQSPFNKKPLLTKFTDGGNIILTKNSFIKWENGKMTKEEITEEKFESLAKAHFSIQKRALQKRA